MRGILFRAKRIDNGEWVKGYYVKCRGHHYILPVYDTDHGFDERYAEWVEVNPETVCQYTGLTDKNGRKIFEGDIVNCHEKRGAAFWHCIVAWNSAKARFDVINKDCTFPMCFADFYSEFSIDGSDYEVTGNIFDNPDLLELKTEWKEHFAGRFSRIE